MSVVDAHAWVFMHWRSFRFHSLSFMLSVSVVVLWLSSLIDARTLRLKWLKFESCSPHRHTHASCVCWASLLTSSTSPFTSSPISSSLLSSCSSCCLTPCTCLMSWITSPRTSQVSLCWVILGFVGLILCVMEHFYNQIPSSRAGIPSIRKPASREEIISVSVELWETEVCFLHIQHPMLISNLPSHRQNLNLGIIPTYIVVPCFPPNNVVLNSLVWWM